MSPTDSEADGAMLDVHRQLATAARCWQPGESTLYFGKGRVGLYATLKALGIGEGDEVLVPGYTCVVVPAAVSYTGAKPVYYDIDPVSWCGDAAAAQERIGERTRAVIVQHTFGLPGWDEALADTCRERGIAVIEDCAHAMGSMIGDRPMGTLGDAAFGSLQWTKPVTVGLGGVVRVNNPDLLPALVDVHDRELDEPAPTKTLMLSLLAWGYRRFFSPRLYWTARGAYHRVGQLGLAAPSASDAELERPEVMPEGYLERFGRRRMRQLERALARIPALTAHRNRIAGVYREWFTQRGLTVPSAGPGNVALWLRFPFLVSEREELLKRAKQSRVELGDWFNATLHPDIHESEGLGYRKGMCPNAEQLALHAANLPTHGSVDEREAERILGFLDKYVDRIIDVSELPAGD